MLALLSMRALTVAVRAAVGGKQATLETLVALALGQQLAMRSPVQPAVIVRGLFQARSAFCAKSAISNGGTQIPHPKSPGEAS